MKYAIVTYIFLQLTSLISAQDPIKPDLAKLVASVNKNAEETGIEKLYVHTDKSIYASGDTLWFKAYLLEASYFNASSKSGLMYLEIADDSNRVVKRSMVPVYFGTAYGQVALKENDIPQGNYVLRAYTSWMRNFSEAHIFKKHFYVSNAGREWLVNYTATPDANTGNQDVSLMLKFSGIDKLPLGSREMRLTVSGSRRNWFRDDVKTLADGTVNMKLNFPAARVPKDLSLTVRDLGKDGKDHRQVVPLTINALAAPDLQFMPEGGTFLADHPARIGFKALHENGFGIDVSGKILNSKGEQVAGFLSGHKGMGSFQFVPRAGETYSAVVDGAAPGKAYALPPVQTSGVTLQVVNKPEDDSCYLVIRSSPDMISATQRYFLVAQARGVVCYAAHLTFRNELQTIKISKKTFPTGITRFVITGTDRKVVSQRIAFINHEDNLNIKLTAAQARYGQRDSVQLQIDVSDAEGNPVEGNFSLAVTDDGQVKPDSPGNPSLITQLLLTSELNGHIEDPGYYFQKPSTAVRAQHLDELLLTQGWAGFEWTDMINPPASFEHQPEEGFKITGRVTNMLNRPVPGSGVLLMTKYPLTILDTLTDNQGSFTFTGLAPSDTAVFFIQSRNRKNKSFNVGIEMNEFSPPVFSSATNRVIPWYVNTDSAMLLFVTRKVELEKQREEITGVKMLAEVVVTAKRVVKDSKNLNGPGEADIIIGEEELQQAGRRTLGDLLEERVKGFGRRVSKTGAQYYAITDKTVHLIIDGVETEFFQPEGVSLYEFLKQYFDYYDAEEIKGIEVMTSGKYQMRYTTRFLDPMAVPWDHAFIEVTTRGGRGPFVKKAVGTYLYRPMPFILPQKFYSPKYLPGSTPDMTDTRSTVFWEPNIFTGKDGKATVSFYTADNPGSYTLIIEGCDMAGGLGSQTGKIIVEKNSAATAGGLAK